MQLSVPPNPRVRCRVVHEDPAFLVIAKSSGVVTQPGKNHARDTLLNFAFAHHGAALQALGRARDFGLVHRLDRPSSGLVLVGLTPEGYDGLRAQFEARTIRKIYLALVHSVPRPESGTIRDPIREVRRGGRKSALVGVHPHAKGAVTHDQTIACARGAALLECRIETGRLHQIRAHLAHRGCPVVGDREYGPRDARDKAFAKASRKAIFLHAGALRFAHPVDGRILSVLEPLPQAHLGFLDDLTIETPRKWR